jgi:hypothetical protein
MLADDLQGDVADLLNDPDYGRNVTVRKTVAGTYDPSNGSTTAVTVTDYPTRGLILAYKDALVTGSLIRIGDRKCIIRVKGLGVALTETDDLMLLVGTDKYTVVSMKTGSLGETGTVYLYVFQIRK